MDGRFPFPQSDSQRTDQVRCHFTQYSIVENSTTRDISGLPFVAEWQMTPAQWRAALGLTSVSGDQLPQLYSQIQQRQQESQRDMQLRQLLLQEQLDQQLQEQQLRSLSERLNDYSGLQNHYRSLLLNEQMQRRTGEQAYLRHHVEQQAATLATQQQEAQLRYQEGLRRQQELLSRLQEVPNDTTSDLTSTHLATRSDLYGERSYSVDKEQSDEHTLPAAAQTATKVKSLPHIKAKATTAKPKQKANRQDSNVSIGRDGKKKERGKARKYSKGKGLAAAKGASKQKSPAFDLSSLNSLVEASVEATPSVEDLNTVALEQVAIAADMAIPQIICKGTVEELLSVATNEQKVDDAAGVLTMLSSLKDVDWAEDEDSIQESYNLVMTDSPAREIRTSRFKSALPKLPEEKVCILMEGCNHEAATRVENTENKPQRPKEKNSIWENVDASSEVEEDQRRPKKVSAVLEYPFPVDTWWPSVTGIRRERRQAGETSDEDDFIDESESYRMCFRANQKKLKTRLAKKLEPGVLEKLPHCRIHRIRTKRKKNSTAPELVYCWQVTEIYPNDIMVNCSGCGTWRHAACGGHFEPVSNHCNSEKPFVAICENCNAEEAILRDFPESKRRIERQRMEQLRRSLATSAVMRHASFSKHSGTYKWPLGSVSATHIGGHTRSVHARHDKVVKQWSDMATRLERGFGYRSKERVRVRTKELERLLVSIEDAEGYTDRHNMLLFLMRDTSRESPAGFENQRRNFFDPAEDPPILTNRAVGDEDAKAELQGEACDGSNANVTPSYSCCAAQFCGNKPRFDSVFCSDGCGVKTMELDLLRSFQDASDIHPAVLRH
jgi:hypothetical protein